MNKENVIKEIEELLNHYPVYIPSAARVGLADVLTILKDQPEIIYKKIPQNCQECIFGEEMICLLDGSPYPTNEVCDPDFNKRYSNCSIKKDEAKNITITFI